MMKTAVGRAAEKISATNPWTTLFVASAIARQSSNYRVLVRNAVTISRTVQKATPSAWFVIRKNGRLTMAADARDVVVISTTGL